MSRPQLPDSLISRLRAGRAALVVGSNIGALAQMPSWKKLLERLVGELARRGQPGDAEAAEDCAALLKKGRFVSAAGFLARTLGGDACDAVLSEAWRTPDPLPEAIQVLGRIPVRAVWTVHPGDLVERAVQAGSPDGWPAPRVLSYEQAGEVDPRRRYVLKLLGDLKVAGSYVVIPSSVRRRLAGRADYRRVLEDLYRDGALVFVGFRQGDPDLAALLDRVFGTFEPPQVEHWFVGAGLGPVDIEELRAEHHMSVIPLEGQGGDAQSTESLVAWLTQLADACAEAGITLSMARPAPDDLEGWAARAEEDPSDVEAQDALLAIESAARQAGQADRLVEALLARVQVVPEGPPRAALLRELARTFEKDIGDLPRAFTALTAALREDPADEETVREAERLAAETDGWGELVTDLADVVPQIEDEKLAAAHWVRLGRWYAEKLRHPDYAVASFREALKRDPRRSDARAALEELYRKQQKWGELAEELAAHAEMEDDPAKRVDVLLALGDLYETQLASTAKAIEAYERALLADSDHEDALGALERLYRRVEQWGKLAAVLERRADLLAATDPVRAAQVRKDLAALRSEKLGDVEGAIAKFEATLEANPRDLEALRSLEKLYERAGRTEDYLRVLERYAEIGPESERAATWRRVAAEVEEREGGRARAIRAYEQVLLLEPGATHAYRALERLHRLEGNWEEVVRLYERQIAVAAAPAQRVELWAALGELLEKELSDPHRAIEAHAKAIDLAPDHRESLAALARLYRRVEAWEKAVATLTKHAELLGPRGADLWYEAGTILADALADPMGAEARFVKALELDPTHLPTHLALVELYRKRRDWAKAAQTMIEAERHTQNRLEKVRLLFEAAQITEEWLDRPEAAVELYARVLTLDPEHVESGLRVSRKLVAEERWAEAEPILEMLARKADPTDRDERARREALLGRAYEMTGQLDKAEKRYRLAVEADPDSVEAALGLGGLLYSRGQWAAADEHYRQLLARHRKALAEGQVVEIWHRIGVAARERGDALAAEDAFRRALERDPGHRPSLLAVVELASARGDWKAVLEAKRNALDGATEDERVKLLEEIGDLSAQKLEDPVTALGAYLEALKIRPRSHVLLHKTLDLYTEQKEWRRALETLERLAEQEKDVARRAKYHYAAAVIARDELHDTEQAVEHFTRALDDAPTLPKAFEAVERILGDKQDWKGLARAYRKMIKRLGDRATEEQLLPLWTRLGDVAAQKLGDRESAIAAYEVAVKLDPKDDRRHEQLAALYLQAGPDRADKAIAEVQYLLKRNPDRLELYKTLSRLYRQTEQTDKAYCVAAALGILGSQDEEERLLFDVLRPKGFQTAKRRLTEELWQKNVIHPREDRALNGIFASLMASLAATTAQPHSALALNPKEQTDPDKSPHPVARIFRYAVQTLGIEPQPELYLREGSKDGVRAANVAEKGVLTPAVLIGEPFVGRRAEKETAFEVAKKLSFFRPERYVVYALATLPKLQAAIDAALMVTGVKNGKHSPELERLSVHLRRTVPEPVLESVAALGRKLSVQDSEQAIAAWLTSTDLTANRVGLILANDLETAARMVATEQGAPSGLSAKDRLRELLSYAVSEEYFTVRRHLGLEVGSA